MKQGPVVQAVGGFGAGKFAWLNWQVSKFL